jgi:hypothetical protein
MCVNYVAQGTEFLWPHELYIVLARKKTYQMAFPILYANITHMPHRLQNIHKICDLGSTS